MSDTRCLVGERFTDWGPNHTADGTIDHATEVSGRTSSGLPRISQKTPNHSNILLSQDIQYAASDSCLGANVVRVASGWAPRALAYSWVTIGVPPGP